MTQNLMPRHGGLISAGCLDQLAPVQSQECGLNGALGQPSPFGHSTQTRRKLTPVTALRLPIEIKIYQECGGSLIVADEVAH